MSAMATNYGQFIGKVRLAAENTNLIKAKNPVGTRTWLQFD
jgi:hypothetical protein